MNDKIILPGGRLGLLGGGQLGRMFAQAAATMGYTVTVLEPDPNAPAAAVASHHICAPYTDPEALKALADEALAVTTEFENVPAPALRTLSERIFTAPGADAVSVTQDRCDEKQFIVSAGVAAAPHQLITSVQDCEAADDALFPGILKTARLGYDGKGQIGVQNRQALREAFEKLGAVRCVLEKKLPLALEVSVIAARGRDGQTVVFPLSENYHKNGILAVSIMPARVSPSIAEKAKQAALAIINKMNYVGVLCTEFFVLSNGELVVNELAPRPHNSGHATIDACVCSQYEQQVRAMAGLPLGDTRQTQFSVMLNLLGDLWFDEAGSLRTPHWESVLDIPGVKLHLYGKKEPRRARKMGHITVVADTPDEALFQAQMAASALGLEVPV